MDIDKYNQDLELLLDPDTVYHYTSAQVAMEHILKDKKLRLSAFSNSNDPMEYKPNLFGVTIWGERENLDNNARIVNDNLNKLTRHSLRFVSFCRNRETSEIESMDTEHINSRILGCFRPRMWTQYGDGHKGVCIAFSLKELENELEFRGKRNHDFYSGLVDYYDYPVISKRDYLLKGKEIAETGAEEYAIGYILKNWRKFLFRKHIDYRDECEHRIIKKTAEPHNNYLFIDITKSIRAIILADNFNKIYYPLISIQSKELNIFA